MKTQNSYLFNPLAGNFIAWFLAFCCFSLTEYFNGYGDWFYEEPRLILLGVLIGTVWSTRLHAYREAWRIYRKVTINHTHRFFQRTVVALLIAYAIHIAAERDFTFQVICRANACVLFIGGVFWFTFDFILNRDRGKELFYVSSWYGSAWVDRIFSKLHSPLLWLISKGVLLIGTYYLYLYTLQNPIE